MLHNAVYFNSTQHTDIYVRSDEQLAPTWQSSHFHSFTLNSTPSPALLTLPSNFFSFILTSPPTSLLLRSFIHTFTPFQSSSFTHRSLHRPLGLLGVRVLSAVRPSHRYKQRSPRTNTSSNSSHSSSHYRRRRIEVVASS